MLLDIVYTSLRDLRDIYLSHTHAHREREKCEVIFVILINFISFDASQSLGFYTQVLPFENQPYILPSVYVLIIRLKLIKCLVDTFAKFWLHNDYYTNFF